jgi:glutamine synthetase
MTLEELRAAVAAGTIDTVLLAITDMQGRLQGKRLVARFFLDEIAEHGAEGCNYLLAVDVDMNTVEGYAMASWERGYGDFVMRPDLSTLRLVPWQEATALCLADVVWHDGSDVVASPRQVLRRQLERLAERDGPLFARRPALFDSFLAGQLAALRELTLLLAPNINSYKRYAPGSFAPTAIAWGRDNRTCALRVVGHGNALRFENRCGGADLNPYLALAVLIAAGLHGVDTGLELPLVFEGDAYRDPALARLPSSLAAARELFAASEVARAAFGADVVEHYVNAADVELAAFGRAVTDWERHRGFERL